MEKTTQRPWETDQTIEVTVTPTKVIGAGGRTRTAYICNDGCWHSSFAQAKRCKNAKHNVWKARQ